MYQKFDHDKYARSCAPDDFWRQIRRTVQGEPVSAEQITMIVDAIKFNLRISSDDVLLDLACGNGALAHLLFDSCAEYFGVDLSEYLISIAHKNFELLPSHKFLVQGAAEYLRLESQPEKYSKALCYGSFSYFTDNDAADVIQLLFEKFINLKTVYIGNLPDKDRAKEFYKGKDINLEELLDHSSQIGIWRTKNDFLKLASNAGWNITFPSIHHNFYASHYRYDVLLRR
jgi:SAM-dependent methyltransferase